MSSFEEECNRLSWIADPEGTEKRNWDAREGQALSVATKTIEKTFKKSGILVASFRFDPDLKETMMIVCVASKVQPLICFTLKPKDSKLHIWPFSNKLTKFKISENYKVTVVDGFWDIEDFEKYFASIFSELQNEN